MTFEIPDTDAEALLDALPGLLQAAGTHTAGAASLARLYELLSANPRHNTAHSHVAASDAVLGADAPARHSQSNNLCVSLSAERYFAPSPGRATNRPCTPDNTLPQRTSESPAIDIALPRGQDLLPAFMLRWPSPTPGSPPHTPFNNTPGRPLLSPLQLVNNPSTPTSPSSTVVGSQQGTSPEKDSASVSGLRMFPQTYQSQFDLSMSLLGKRSATDAGWQDEPTRRSRRIASAAGAGDPGESSGGDDDDGDYAEATARRRRRRRPGERPPCPRGGDAARTTRPSTRNRVAASVAGMRAQLENDNLDVDEDEGEAEKDPKSKKGKGKAKGKVKKGGKKAKEVVWNGQGDPPPATRDPALRLVQLGMISLSPDLQNKLRDFLLDLTNETSPTIPDPQSSPFAAALTRCAILETRSVLDEFELMVGYIEAALHIQWRKSLPVPTGQRPLSYTALALEASDKRVNSDSIRTWFKIGTRLIYLAASSSMYILPMIAVCGLKRRMCKEDYVDTIEQMGYLLCAPHRPDHPHTLSRDCAEVTRKLIVPQMVFIKQVSTHLSTKFSLKFPPDADGIIEIVPFADVDGISSRLRKFDFNYFQVPPADSCWSGLKNPLLAPALPLKFDDLNLTEDCVANEITIKTPLNLKATPCPVNPENSYEWTYAERGKAAVAPVVESVEDLELRLKTLHAGGTKLPDQYVCIPSEICEGDVLTLRGKNNQLLAMLVTNLTETLPHLETISVPIISAIMAGDVFSVNSAEDPMFKYCSTHKVWYNRYSEQGHGAPKDVHPNYCRKEGTKHTNFSQRAPHPSEEMKEDPDETELMAEFISLIAIIMEFHIKKLLPEEYDEISVFVSRLPLNERSHAHPFGGFVINVRVSTRGHRDGGDKLFCVVIPFGTWTGGELGLFEPGFLFRLRAWDALIFPSCDITHFNLDFEGTRLSLVLHSDKYGDRWVQDQNGWASRDVTA
ncbi:hypothetical protein DFH09DRAFT_1281711 [Mycena vulgaris]|nr:hypothetical protein DFH09DRAFT_1281711 [Mycena vulgaris]